MFDVEVGGQTVKPCLIKHRFQTPQAKSYGTQITQRTSLQGRDLNMAECESSRVAIQRFKLKKSIAAIILLDILEEGGKRENR